MLAVDTVIALVVAVAQGNYEPVVSAASLARCVHDVVPVGLRAAYQAAESLDECDVLALLGSARRGLRLHALVGDTPLVAARRRPFRSEGRAFHGQASGEPKNTCASVSLATRSTASRKASSNARSARHSSYQNTTPLPLLR